jgi:(p)ppGpp synthase/HD superfamily hydrolase
MERMDLNRAIALACEAHQDQLDKGSKPYILHPLRVMMKMQTEEAKMAAVLHDVVEDSKMTLQELESLGCPSFVLGVIDALSYRQAESYWAYIQRVGKHPCARVIKIADLEDNMDMTRLRLRDMNDRDLERLSKYHRAWRYLVEASAVSFSDF